MDTDTIARAESVIRETADAADIALDRLIVFGSRARDDYRADSDIDILIVSPDFRDTPYYKRPVPFYDRWPYDALPDPEFICLTPDEFEERRQRQPNIVRTAVEDGVSLA